MAATPETVRAFVLEQVERDLATAGLTPADTPDDFDLLAEGVIDSFGIVDLIAAIEQRFDVRLDFERLDPDRTTVVGPLSEHVAHLVEQRGTAR